MKKYIIALLIMFASIGYTAELQVNKITASESIAGPSGSVVYSNEVLTAYQPYSSIVTQDAGGTATIVYAHGSLVKIVASTNITITFDNTDYPTNGVNRVAVELFTGTNSATFLSSTITNNFSSISTSDWNSLYFRKSCTNVIWTGRK